ncbi:hypothetical protein [Pseudonocardia sp. MH-G8]|nr:hypothetical protein [Pseudonocardia sp. MH-G8]
MSDPSVIRPAVPLLQGLLEDRGVSLTVETLPTTRTTPAATTAR